MSGVILHLAALSRFLFLLLFVKAFLWFADKKVLLRLWRHLFPLPFPYAVQEPSQSLAKQIFRHKLQWSGMKINGKSMRIPSLASPFLYRHHLLWFPLALSQSFPAEWRIVFSKRCSEMSIFSTDCFSMRLLASCPVYICVHMMVHAHV